MFSLIVVGPAKTSSQPLMLFCVKPFAGRSKECMKSTACHGRIHVIIKVHCLQPKNLAQLSGDPFEARLALSQEEAAQWDPLW